MLLCLFGSYVNKKRLSYIRVTTNSLNYKPTILRIIRYRLIIKTKLNSIKNQRSFGVLNKFLKGVNIINTNPIILLIKNRGYLVIFVQKLFIKIIIIKWFI